MRRQPWKAILVALLVIMTSVAQTASLASTHSDNHASHCCGVCHAGHVSVLQAVDHFSFVPLTFLCWHQPHELATRALRPLPILNLSRAPPISAWT